MNVRYLYILIGILLVGVLSACGDSAEGTDEGAAADSIVVPDTTQLRLSPQQVDSLTFRLTHHYSENYNFVLKADSLRLVPRDVDMLRDTCWVYKGDLLVVAQLKRLDGRDSITAEGDTIVMPDTILVKVAHDQWTMGWVEESELLETVVPDDPLSSVIDWLTGRRAIWMSVLVLLGVIGFFLYLKFPSHPRNTERRVTFSAKRWFVMLLDSQMNSFYPSLLVVLVAVVATLYVGVQTFVPEFWQEYYFHPTMNPLLLPPVMALLVTLVWLTLIVFIAVVIEVYNHFFFSLRAVTYLLEICGLCMVVYLLMSIATRLYVGYFLLLFFVWHVVRIYFRYVRSPYICGHCGQRMRRLGTCPHCGKLNE